MSGVFKVTFRQGMHSDDNGTEIRINKLLEYDGNNICIPSLHIFGMGIVADYCHEIDSNLVEHFFDKWKNIDEDVSPYLEQVVENESPLVIKSRKELTLNGKKLHMESGRTFTWYPTKLSGFNSHNQAEIVIKHYDLDQTKVWVIERVIYSFEDEYSGELKDCAVLFKRKVDNIPMKVLPEINIGDTFEITNDITGIIHEITIHECNKKTLDVSFNKNDDYEYPEHYVELVYSVEPEIKNGSITIRDTRNSDEARTKNSDKCNSSNRKESVGAVFLLNNDDVVSKNGKELKAHTSASSLRFDPDTRIEWYISLNVKTGEDAMFKLL